MVPALKSGGVPMTVITHLRSTNSTAILQRAEPLEQKPVVSHLVGRLIQIALAFYLLPALLAVLVIGSMGILILKAAQLLTGPAKRLT
jgi:hypothetical protein